MIAIFLSGSLTLDTAMSLSSSSSAANLSLYSKLCFFKCNNVAQHQHCKFCLISFCPLLGFLWWSIIFIQIHVILVFASPTVFPLLVILSPWYSMIQQESLVVRLQQLWWKKVILDCLYFFCNLFSSFLGSLLLLCGLLSALCSVPFQCCCFE